MHARKGDIVCFDVQELGNQDIDHGITPLIAGGSSKSN